MGEGLGLSYSQMGVISTVNFCGYLGAVLLCGYFSTRLGPRLLIFLALLLVSVSMILVGLAAQYRTILVLYFLTGVGSALSNVPIMALIGIWFDTHSRGRAAGLCVMGNGLGILVTGRAVPVLNSMHGDWRLSWIVLGAVAGIIACICYLLFRNTPKAGKKTVTATAGARANKSSQETGKGRTERAVFYHCGAIYFLFGFTYVIYVTFLVTSLVQDRGLSEQAAGELWAWVGLLSLVSGPLFGYLSDKYTRKAALGCVFFIQAGSYLLVAGELPIYFVYLSLALYGIAAWSIPTIMAALVGDLVGPERTAAVFGFVTFLFGIGQIAGPACGGFLAEQSGSFSNSFLTAAVLASLAIVLSLLLPSEKMVGLYDKIH